VEGERSSTGAAPEVKRWSANRKKEAVLRLLRGEPVDALNRELSIEIYRLEEWREKALQGMDTALKSREGDLLSAELDSAMRRIQPISSGLLNHYGSVQANVARGLTIRMDNGSQYLSDHFQKQLKFWGIASSFAFVREPETNGVAERFNRTLKEQVIYSRTFMNIEEVRVAMTKFVRQYNQLWQVEKINCRSPEQARRDFYKNAA
jgi:transposase InsO family protein